MPRETSRAESALARTDLARLFGPNGPVAGHLPDYEARPSQRQMAEAVKDALLTRTNALIEAPTGTGKSLAYLIPALLTGQKVIVATANKSLQHQLYAKDIPLAGRILGRDIDAVVVKGRSNYVCTWKWDRELRERSLLSEVDPDRDQLDAIRAWLRATETGDVDDLPFLPGADLRPRIVSFPDDCLHHDCEHHEDGCWVNFMRDRAAGAEVLITNHHLLLTALRLDDAGERILPAAPIYVIDEAHHLVDTATAVFEVEVTDYALPLLLARKAYRDHIDEVVADELQFENRLVFDEIARLGDAAGRPTGAFRIEGDLPAARSLAGRLKRLAQEMEDHNPNATRSKAGRAKATAALTAAIDGHRAGDPDAGFADALQASAGGATMPERVEAGDPEKVRARLFELAVSNLNSLADKLHTIATSRHDAHVVRYAEPVFGRRFVRLAVHAAPIEPAEMLSAFVFDVPDRTVICTSATLATGGGFEHFATRCGVANVGAALVAPPVFDYPSQALLYQPELTSYAWANRAGFYAAVADEIRRLLEVSRGRALCLFTSWGGLQQARERLAPGDTVWPVRAQGDAPREALLQWFRDTPHSVLLATRSFWEGVDIPGDELSLVVVDKLPFPTPSDPLHAARMKAVDDGGDSSFGQYMLPLMSLALKQGFGRLIRRATDRGVVAILDERLTSKGYGRQVRADLPPARFTRLFADVHRFYRHALAGDADFALNVRAWCDDAAGDLGAGGAGDPAPESRDPGTVGTSPARRRKKRDARPASVRWRWQLCRLSDGRVDGDEGVVTDLPDAVAGEIRAAIAGLSNLRERVEGAGRSPGDFHVEVRCGAGAAAALGGTGSSKRATAGRAQRAAWDEARAGWGGVSVLGLGGAGGTAATDRHAESGQLNPATTVTTARRSPSPARR